MTAHYYRYADTGASLAFVGHFGFFGAALFAFLSGYGTCISYQKKGIVPGIVGNFLQKLEKFYIPFLLVNIVGVFAVYGFRADSALPMRILLGTDDGAMWYLPYILIFYLLFSLIFSQKFSNIVKTEILGSAILIQIIICMILNIDSQWYTASGALLLGVVIAQIDFRQHEKKVRIGLMIGSFLLLGVCSVLTKMTEDAVMISKSFTVLSGVGFSCFFFYLQSMLDDFLEKYEKILLWGIWLGQNSLWLYCIHMKVMEIFYAHPSHLILVYLIVASVVSAMAAFSYNYVKKLFFHKANVV